jgi:hypothetical protein
MSAVPLHTRIDRLFHGQASLTLAEVCRAVGAQTPSEKLAVQRMLDSHPYLVKTIRIIKEGY